MTTKLESPIKRELTIKGEPYVLTIAPMGFKLVPKGKRKGFERSWADFISGDQALATALAAAVIDGPIEARRNAQPSARQRCSDLVGQQLISGPNLSENILRCVPGQYIGAALNTLPKAESATRDIMEDDRRARHRHGARDGQASKSKHGKAVKYFWRADKAVALGQ